EAMAEPLELGAEVEEVVDLAVEDERHGAVVGGEGLVAGARQIEDRQPPVGEADAPPVVEPRAAVVGTAVGDGGAGALEPGGIDRPAVEAEDAGDAAHG